MTEQYLAGELSLLLSVLEADSGDARVASHIQRLRREAETQPVDALGSVAVRALGLADEACWFALDHGDVDALARHAAGSSQIREFGVCAGLLGEVRSARLLAGSDPSDT